MLWSLSFALRQQHKDRVPSRCLPVESFSLLSAGRSIDMFKQPLEGGGRVLRHLQSPGGEDSQKNKQKRRPPFNSATDHAPGFPGSHKLPVSSEKVKETLFSVTVPLLSFPVHCVGSSTHPVGGRRAVLLLCRLAVCHKSPCGSRWWWLWRWN